MADFDYHINSLLFRQKSPTRHRLGV